MQRTRLTRLVRHYAPKPFFRPWDSNFFRTPYYLFCPSDGSDQLASTVDVKALLDWLQSPNRKTGARYLTGKEYFNGLATGVEPIRKSGSARFRSLNVTYAS